MHRLPVFVLALFLSTGWLSDAVRATAVALGLYAPIRVEQPAPEPDNPTTDSGCSMDPWGGCIRG